MSIDGYPRTIDTVEQLEELLSRPTPGLVASMKRLSGDLMILGAGGKVGPTLALMAKRASDAAGTARKIIAVDVVDLPALKAKGIETLRCDMLDPQAVAALPKVENIVFMVGRKFGSTGQESLTWAINTTVPHNVARAFTSSRVASFSTGCVYPVMHIRSGGATEDVPANPVGEYAMSCLGRERMFDFYADTKGERVAHIRLNYAVELRYGVLVDIATQVSKGDPIDVTTGHANGIWQGDACAQAIQALEYASTPATIFNVTGPETFSVRQVATQFGRLLKREPVFVGEENGCGYLSNAAKANALFGNPTVPLGRMIEWIAHWISIGGANIGKPTHFETQNGKY